VLTTGADVDDDGFLLSVDGGTAQPLAANGSTNWAGAAGQHTIAISGLAFNCDLTKVPASASVTLGQTMHVTIGASCTPYLQNAILYTSEEFGLGEIMAMRPDGSRRVRLTTDQLAYAMPVVSPDGQSIAAAQGSWVGGTWNGFDGIYLFDRFGKSRKKLVGRSNFDGSPAWSPDGTRLAFRSMMPGPYGEYGRIWIVGRDGSGLHQLTPENADSTDYTFDDSPTWSPDGKQVLYNHNGELWLINADGSAPTALGVSGSWPAWSPDGSKIAFTSAGGGPTLAVWVANRDGTNVRKLTTPIQQDGWARWSLDGKQLVFTRVENNVSHLYRMDADGTNMTKLSISPKNEDSPSWNPGT
jgi:Tol biopolymer transport system component